MRDYNSTEYVIIYIIGAHLCHVRTLYINGNATKMQNGNGIEISESIGGKSIL